VTQGWRGRELTDSIICLNFATKDFMKESKVNIKWVKEINYFNKKYKLECNYN